MTVIVVSFFESVVRDHSKDHPMAVAYFISDTLTGICTPLCRTSRGMSLPHLIDTVRGLEERGGVRSLQEAIDTPGGGWCSTSSGRWQN